MCAFIKNFNLFLILGLICSFIFLASADDIFAVSEKQSIEDSDNYSLDVGIKLYKNKEYTKAFSVFNKFCDQSNQTACWMLGLCYRFGNGVSANTDKALEIFSSSILINDEYAQLQKAFIYEFDKGDRYNVLNKAHNIYGELKSSKNKEIAKMAQDGYNRLPIYLFLESAFIPISRYNEDIISYDQLEKKLFGLDMTDIPNDIRDSFLALRLPLLKLAKFRSDNSIGSTLLHIGKSAVKGFLLDFSFITDALDRYDGGKEIENFALEQKHYWEMFIDSLNKNDVSINFLNNLERETVDKAMKLPNGTPVALTGRVVSRLADEENTYMFKDATGEMPVIITPKCFEGHRITPDSKVVIVGRMTLLRGEPRVRVKRLELAN